MAEPVSRSFRTPEGRSRLTLSHAHTPCKDSRAPPLRRKGQWTPPPGPDLTALLPTCMTLHLSPLSFLLLAPAQ